MVWNEDQAQQQVGFGNSVTQAVGSDAAIDLSVDGLEEQLAKVGDTASLSTAEALKLRHPDYLANVTKWKKYLDLYMSEDIYRFIHRHMREVDVSWQQRIERGYFYNYVKNVVDLFTAFIFHAPIDRNPGRVKEEFERIYKNADLSGTLWDVFMARACAFAQVAGHVGILVDAPKLPEGGFTNEAERKEAEARPYLTLFHAHQIVDWEIDQFGNFIWVKLRVFRPQDRDWNSGFDLDVQHYQIWTRKDWQEYKLEKNGEGEEVARLVDSGPHKLGRVPFVILRVDKHPTHPWFGQSTVKDIADINIAILNWSSLGDEEIFERCLHVLTVERGEGDAPIELSTDNCLEYEPGTNKPEYLIPGTTPLDLIQSWMERATNEIRRLAKLNISTGLGDVRQAASGIAKAFSFLETNQSLVAKAMSLEQVETELHVLLSAWLGEAFDGSIQYPREFGVEDFLTLFQGMDMARTSLTTETGIKELEKKLTRKLFAKDEMKLRAKIEKEIDEADTKMPSVESAFGMMPPLGQPGGEEGAKKEDQDASDDSEKGDGGPNTGEATAA
jgi:hypothetical protein